jgi:hypothetical protein
MRKTNSESRSVREPRVRDGLQHDELDTVTGGSFELSNVVSGVIKSTAAALDTSAPPSVWVGCAWVPQWW